MYTKNQHTTGL